MQQLLTGKTEKSNCESFIFRFQSGSIRHSLPDFCRSARAGATILYTPLLLMGEKANA
jgi:hypothetical protein